MQHRMGKVLLPRQIELENATEMIYNLFRTAVISMFAFIAYTHRPKDLLTLKLSGQDEAFKQMASVLCFLADFLRESPDLLGLMSDLELDLGSRYMRSRRDFVDIKRAIRQIDLDFQAWPDSDAEVRARERSDQHGSFVQCLGHAFQQED
jgi:hypothetical protein